MTVRAKVLGSVEPVIKQSKFVATDLVAISNLAVKIKDTEIPNWDHELQLLGTPEETIQYYFIVDSIQGTFWPEKGKDRWYFEKDGTWLKGYYAFSYAVRQAVLKDKKYLDADFLTEISFEDFKNIFKGKGELPLLPERHQALRENFRILIDKYGGLAANLVASADKDVNKLVFTIVSEFPTFNDKATWNNSEVYFWKRAQIFPSDIYFALQGKELGEFNNLEDLSVFADYRLPQLLQAEGVLKYNSELLQKIKNEEVLPSGSVEEVEIRAHTVWASDLLLQELEREGRNMTSQQLDWILWNLTQGREFELPHHRTPTIYY